MPAPTTIHYLVATQEFAPEVAYTARLLSLIIGCGCAFPRDCPDAPSTPCVYYGSEPRNKPPGALWIRPDRGFWSQLERDRTALPTGNVSWDKTILPCWAESTADSPQTPADCPADPVAASFFLASRAEEYNALPRDSHGRFPAAQTWMVRNSLIERPLLHEYAEALAERLGIGPNQRLPRPWPAHAAFAVAFTHDIDRLKMHGPLLRDLLGTAGQCRFPGGLRAAARRLKSSLKTRLGRSPDPYDNIPALTGLHDAHGFKASFLWLASAPSRQNSDYDLTTPEIAALLGRLQQQGHECGLHGSYDSVSSPHVLVEERRRLEEISGQAIRSTRQHYLRFHAPETWEAQIAAGLQTDTTLGFASRIGYRAGLAVPFRPWSLRTRRPLAIWEIPLLIMDATLREYMRLPAEDAIARSRAMIESVRDCGGAAALLWHNSSLNEIDWRGWTPVYESWLESTRSLNGWGGTLSDIAERWEAYAESLGCDPLHRSGC